MTLAICGIFDFLRKEWESMRILMEVALILLIMMIIFNIMSLFLVV